MDEPTIRTSKVIRNLEHLDNSTTDLFHRNYLDTFPNHTDQCSQKTLECLLQDLRVRQLGTLYGEYHNDIFVFRFMFCILGFIINTFIMIVLVKTPRSSNSRSVILIVMIVVGFINFTTQFAHSVHYYSGFTMYPFYSWTIFYIINTFFENVSIYVLNWLVAAVVVWRCVSIAWPFQYREICSWYRAKVTVISVLLLSTLISTPVLFLYTYKEYKNTCAIFYGIDLTEIAKYNDGLFHKVFLVLQLLRGIAPMIVTTVVTVWMIASSYRICHQRNTVLQKGIAPKSISQIAHRTTLKMSLLLLPYWLSNVPDSFVFLLHFSAYGNAELQTDYRKCTDVLRIFSIANISLSFFIYFGLGEDFRESFHDFFFKIIVQLRKNGNSTIDRSATSSI